MQVILLQAIFSSVIPGEKMKGSMGGMIQFPGWLGKNSSRGKTDRQLQELQAHLCLKYIFSRNMYYFMVQMTIIYNDVAFGVSV